MGVITGNIDARGGTGTIELDDLSLPTTTMRLSSIGNMSIEYDIEDDSETAKTVFYGDSRLKFKAFDRLGNGSSLFEELSSIAVTDPILVDLSFNTDGGDGLFAELEMFSRDIEYDRVRREVTMDATVNATTSATIDAIFNNNPSDVQQYATSQEQSDLGSTQDCMSANDFIVNTLPLLGRDGALSTFYDVNNLSQYFSDDYNSSDGQQGWIVRDENNTDFTALELILRICAIEGCIFGAIFDEAFIVNRLSTANDVSVSESDTKSLNIKIGWDEYKTIKVVGYGESAINSFVTNASLVGQSDNLNENGTKSLSVYFDFTDYDLSASEWDATNGNYIEQAVTNDTTNRSSGVFVDQEDGVDDGLSRFFIDDGSGGSAPASFSSDDLFYTNQENTRPLSVPYIVNNQTSSEMIIDTVVENKISNNVELKILSNGNRNEVAERGADCYKKAFSADASRKISIEFFDLDLLKPYETFTLDSTFPSAIQNQTYRPSKMTYNFDTDTIKVEAYQIA